MNHRLKTAIISFVLCLVTLFAAQNILAQDLENSGITISDIYCENGTLSIVVENNGRQAIDENAQGGLYIWIDGELEWTYNWVTWSCQDFRKPGGSCVIQPQGLDDGEHFIKACLMGNDEAGNMKELYCMEKKIFCGEKPYDPQNYDKSALIISDIYCDNGVLSILVENIGSETIHEDAQGGLNIWIDGNLEWTYSWSTWSCQDFRTPGGSCVIQPQVLSGGGHVVKACLVADDGTASRQEFYCMEKKELCDEEPVDPNDPPEGNCVTADDFFSAEQFGLPSVILGDITVEGGKHPDGTDVKLDVKDCSGDGALDISIPWSESGGARPTSIFFSKSLCPQGYPQVVKVVLRHWNYATLNAFNASGTMVATKSAFSGSTVQTVTLASPDGIERVDFDGSEICVMEICWECRGGDIEDPVDVPCPKLIEEAYQRGYEAGLAAAGGEEEGGMCATYNVFNGTLKMPCLQLKGFGDNTYWVDFELDDPKNMTFTIKDAGLN